MVLVGGSGNTTVLVPRYFRTRHRSTGKFLPGVERNRASKFVRWGVLSYHPGVVRKSRLDGKAYGTLQPESGGIHVSTKIREQGL